MSRDEKDLVDAVHSLGNVVRLREDLAVQMAHVQRLLAEKHVLLTHIRELNEHIGDLKRAAMLTLLRDTKAPLL